MHLYARATARFCVLLSVAAASASEATADTPALTEVQQWHALLQQQWAAGEQPSATPEFPGLTDELASAKLNQVRSLASLLSGQSSQHAKTQDEPVSPPLLTVGPTGAGSRCETALIVKAGDRAELVLPQGRQVWIRWHAGRTGAFLLSSRGSQADTRIEQIASCMETEATLASDDDSFGLNAELGVEADFVGEPFLFRISNSSLADQVTLSLNPAIAVSGRVLDESNGAGIPGVGVAIQSSGTSWLRYAGQTDAAGRFRILANADTQGSYLARTFDQYGSPDSLNYVHEVLGGAYCWRRYNDFHQCGPSATVDIPAEGRGGIDFHLGPGHTLHGRVSDRESGAPLANAQVEASPSTFTGPAMSTVTDDLGNYRLTALVPGRYLISAEHSEYRGRWHDDQPCSTTGCWSGSVSAIELADGQSSDLDFRLTKYAYIEATLQLERPAPDSFPFVYVSLRRPNGAVLSSTFSFLLAGGKVRLGPLEPGEYLVQIATPWSFYTLYPSIVCPGDCNAEIAQAEPVVVSGPGDVVRITLPITHYPSIRGRITEAGTGAPLAQSVVRLWNVDVEGVHSGGVGAQADETGHYEFDTIRPGTYLLQATSTQHEDRAHPGTVCETEDPRIDCPDAAPIALDLQSGDYDIDFELSRRASVRMRLFSGATRIDVGQHYFWYEPVSVLDSSNQPVPGLFTSTLEDANELVISDLEPGDYRIGVNLDGFWPRYRGAPSCPPALTYPSSAFSGCVIESADVLSVGTEDVGWDIDLEPSYARRTRAVDALSLAGIADVSIDLWDSQGRLLSSAVTDANGDAWTRVPGGGSSSSPVSGRLSTDNYAGYLDQVYRDISCPRGTSPFKGNCSLSAATPMAFPNLDPQAEALLFRLVAEGNAPEPVIFDSGFE